MNSWWLIRMESRVKLDSENERGIIVPLDAEHGPSPL